MPSYAHYIYLLPDGNYGTWGVSEFTPDEYVYRWGVNLTQTRDIEQGGEVRITEDGDVLVVAALVPNDGTP